MSDLRERLERHAVPFLACLEGCSRDDAWNSVECWQTFTDACPKPSPDPLAKHWHQSLDEAAPELERLNGAGAGAFITVSRTDGRGRKKSNIRAIRGHHADLDSKDATEPFDLARLPLAPTMAVRTPGGWHLYWLALEPMPCDGEARWKEHEAELKAIAGVLAPCGADANACDVSRVLRVPGFMHRKAEPRLVELVTVDGPRYTREQIREAFPPVPPKPKGQASTAPTNASMVPRPERAEVLERAGRYLDTMPEGIQGQSGSGATFNAALKIIDGYDLTEDEALSLMVDRYNPRCVPPWTVEELRKKSRDAAPHCQERGHLLARRVPAGLPCPSEPEGFELPPLPDDVNLSETKPLRPEKPPLRCLKVMTAGAVLAAEIGPPRWVWDGWIPRGKVGMLAAVSDHGKTALMLQIAAGVGSGCAVLGIPTTTHPCGVLLYSLEDDPEDFQPRLRWVLEGMESIGTLSQEDRANVSKNLWFASPTYEVPDMRFERTAIEIRGHLSAMRKQGIEPALVIVETLSAVTEGDESQANTTRALWASARNIANNEDVTVLITHHYRKETGGGKANRSSVVERIEPDKMRGSSANEGAARFVIQMGLPTMDEAEGAGLDGHKALNKGYAILRASKLKAHKPDMLFLERIDRDEPGQHTWARHARGEVIIANLLKSSGKLKELNLEDRVMVELFRQGSEPDREKLKEIFKTAKNPDKSLTNALFGLRNKKDVEPRKLLLTIQGRERAKSLAAEWDEAAESIGTPWGLDFLQSLPQEMPQEAEDHGGRKVSLSCLPSLGSPDKREINPSTEETPDVLPMVSGADWDSSQPVEV